MRRFIAIGIASLAVLTASIEAQARKPMPPIRARINQPSVEELAAFCKLCPQGKLLIPAFQDAATQNIAELDTHLTSALEWANFFAAMFDTIEAYVDDLYSRKAISLREKIVLRFDIYRTRLSLYLSEQNTFNNLLKQNVRDKNPSTLSRITTCDQALKFFGTLAQRAWYANFKVNSFTKRIEKLAAEALAQHPTPGQPQSPTEKIFDKEDMDFLIDFLTFLAKNILGDMEGDIAKDLKDVHITFANLAKFIAVENPKATEALLTELEQYQPKSPDELASDLEKFLEELDTEEEQP